MYPRSLEDLRRKTMRMLTRFGDDLPIHVGSAETIEARESARDFADFVEAKAKLDPLLALRLTYLANHTFNVEHPLPFTLGSILSRVGAERAVCGRHALALSPTILPTSEDFESIWVHSVQVAIAARFFAQKSNIQGILGDEVYLHGLLHDLGRLILLVMRPKDAERIAAGSWEDGDELLDAEVSVCGFDHSSLGFLAARRWNLPDSLASVVRFHHDPLGGRTKDLDDRTAKLVKVVALSDSVSFAITRSPGDPAAALSRCLDFDPTWQLLEDLSLSKNDVEALAPSLDLVSRSRLAHLSA